MESVNIRSHHLDMFLSILTMPDYRALLLSEMYNEEQKDFANEAIKSYINGELKYITLTKGLDNICCLCPSGKRKANCTEDDADPALGMKYFNVGQYLLADLLDNFDREKFYLELRDRYQSSF